MSETKQLGEKKRYRMYRELLRKQPETWTKEIHAIRIFTNIFTVGFNMAMMYKIYYNHFNPRLPFSYNMGRGMFSGMVFALILGNVGLIYCNYFLLHKLVYLNYYSFLSDRDFSDLYHHVVTRDNLLKNM